MPTLRTTKGSRAETQFQTDPNTGGFPDLFYLRGSAHCKWRCHARTNICRRAYQWVSCLRPLLAATPPLSCRVRITEMSFSVRNPRQELVQNHRKCRQKGHPPRLFPRHVGIQCLGAGIRRCLPVIVELETTQWQLKLCPRPDLPGVTHEGGVEPIGEPMEWISVRIERSPNEVAPNSLGFLERMTNPLRWRGCT